MTPPVAIKAPELTLVTSADVRPAPAADQVAEASSRAPKRMTKRCRRCGKTVPTLAALSWRARHLAASADTAAGQVFRARVESADPAGHDDLLKRAYRTQLEGSQEAQNLLADLRRLQAHDRRCHASAASSAHPRLAPTAPEGTSGEGR